MNFRNPSYNHLGTIDCEIEHPVYGWIPFTANPDDTEQSGKDIYAAIIAAGNITAYQAPAITSSDLITYTATKRFEVETAGIVIDGQTIDTSRESQSMITGAYTYSQAHPTETIKFKSVSGWVTLDSATLAAIATAVGAHVQACFSVEATIDSSIANGSITTTAEIDSADWPSNS